MACSAAKMFVMKWRLFILVPTLLVSGVLIGAPGVGAAQSGVPKAGKGCKVAGQVAGSAPSQLICQRTSKKKLIWARVVAPPVSTPTTNPTNAPSTGPSVPNTAKYLSRPTPSSATAAAALFNEQGKNGYAYVGPFFVGGSSHEIFVKAETNTTYAYDVIEKTPDASTPTGLLARLAAKGKEGFLFKAPAFFGTDFSTSYLVFVKSSSKKTTYSYRSTAWPTDEPTMLTDLNANGAAGFAYVGDFIPDPLQIATGVRLFVKDDSGSSTFSYTTKPQLVDRAPLLAEIVSAGSDKATWRGGYVFGAGTVGMQTRTLYEKSSATTKPASCSFRSPGPTNVDALLAAANENATKGELFWGQYQVGAEIVSVYCNAPLTTLPLVGAVLP